MLKESGVVIFHSVVCWVMTPYSLVAAPLAWNAVAPVLWDIMGIGIVVQQDDAVIEVTVTFDLDLGTQFLKSALIVLSCNLQCPLVLCGHIPHVVYQS
jgi:hypothetical protein